MKPCSLPTCRAGLSQFSAAKSHIIFFISPRKNASCKFTGDDLQLRGNLLGEPQLFPLLVEFHHF
jgi:hypothetical protein